MIDMHKKIELIETYGTAILDTPICVDKQYFQHDLIFVWSEDCTILEEIKIINIQSTLMIDINKKYRVVLEEIEILN